MAECPKCGMPEGPADEQWYGPCPNVPCPYKETWEPTEDDPGRAAVDIDEAVDKSDAEARSTFDGFLQQKMGQGYGERHLLLLAMISINLLIDAQARWQDMEYTDDPRSAPLWLKEREARQLLKLLRGLRSIEARSIRRAIRATFPDLQGE